ncbi:glycosyl hydrolase [Clostridium sp. 1001271B_151109_B4]|uniref:glycosyl hydrolase n=1 Tax=Clostridium sp. 1001271B_151109_B4 TaxID=2787148 RepID=UPI0018A8A24C|nr:glycosyl hydrolase [Clostridium sp. 1001271B_151109_B4]
MKKLTRLLLSGICLLSVLYFIGCNSAENKAEVDSELKGTTEINGELEGVTEKVNVWLAYWDTLDFEEEIEYWKDRISNIIYFAAYFDENNKLFVPDNITETKEVIDELYEEKSWGNYISFVNDKVYSNGKSTLKDTELLYELFESEESIDNHVNEIINIAIEGGYDGIEIDYEKIRKDLKLWDKFIYFLEKLIKEAEEYNLPIRVLLEPSTPVDEISLPKGPEYIMMCYNLYGYGTEPGPKANREFLLELVDKMKKVSDNRGYALATGGFDFANNGEVNAITKQEAERLLENNSGVAVIRDEDSKCNVFEYTDESNVNHEVWYADDVTLKYWEDILSELGEGNISIWKLGETR